MSFECWECKWGNEAHANEVHSGAGYGCSQRPTRDNLGHDWKETEAEEARSLTIPLLLKPRGLNILSHHTHFSPSTNPEGWTHFHIMFFFTFHCLDPLFEVHKGVVFNLLHSFNSTESANGIVPSTSKAIKDMKCMWCSAPLKCFSKVLLGHSCSQIPKKLSLTRWVLNLDCIQRERWEEDKISSKSVATHTCSRGPSPWPWCRHQAHPEFNESDWRFQVLAFDNS